VEGGDKKAGAPRGRDLLCGTKKETRGTEEGGKPREGRGEKALLQLARYESSLGRKKTRAVLARAEEKKTISRKESAATAQKEKKTRWLARDPRTGGAVWDGGEKRS